jgi:hypothetical protein
MRKLFLGLLLFVTFKSVGQNLDCKKFREGKFKIVDLMAGTTIVERKGSKQTEYAVNSRMRLEFKVKWIDDCTYTLKLKKITENPDNVQWSRKVKKTKVIVKIVETKENSYVMKAYSKIIKDQRQLEAFKME